MGLGVGCSGVPCCSKWLLGNGERFCRQEAREVCPVAGALLQLDTGVSLLFVNFDERGGDLPLGRADLSIVARLATVHAEIVDATVLFLGGGERASH